MTDPSPKPTRRTSKLQVWWALALGSVLLLIGAIAVCCGIDTRALETLLMVGFAIIAVGLGVYQGVGAIDHYIARRLTPKESPE
ncbi:MAG: hypothetical protein Alpg2KO_00650 [Alphaproteobacteria bacterium]